MTISRRGFLKWLGVGAAAPAVAALPPAAKAAPVSPAQLDHIVRAPDGTFIAVGEHGDVQTSPDGSMWTQGELYVSLHTADPMKGERAPQYAGGGYVGYSIDHGLRGRPECSEARYKGYARVTAKRDAFEWEWDRDGLASMMNRHQVEFPECVGGDQWISHVSIHDGERILHSERVENGPARIPKGTSPILPPGALHIRF